MLILKTPTRPYPAETREAIWEFVENGGGLWMIGDHTDIFGMNTHLNSIGEKFGIHLNPDSVIDPDTNRQITIPEPTAHPIARSTEKFLWYTGDSVVAPPGIKDVFVSSRMLRDGRDLSKNTYFGDFAPELKERVGPVLQAVAMPWGKGRVAVWTDSTLFSNFSIFLPNKMELAESYVDWLNRENGIFARLRTSVLFVSCFLLLGAFVINNRAAAGSVWLGLSIGIVLVQFANGAGYPQPSKTTRTDVAFYEPGNEIFHLPVMFPFQDPIAGQYLTAFVAAQRAGMRTSVAYNIDEALTGETLVWITPQIPSKEDYNEIMERVMGFVDAGGNLIVLDGGLGSYKIMNDLISRMCLPGSAIEPVDLRNPNEGSGQLPDWAKNLVEFHGKDSEEGFLLWRGSEVLGRDRAEYAFTGGEPLIHYGSQDGPVGCGEVPVRVRHDRSFQYQKDLFGYQSRRLLGDSVAPATVDATDCFSISSTMKLLQVPWPNRLAAIERRRYGVLTHRFHGLNCARCEFSNPPGLRLLPRLEPNAGKCWQLGL